LVGTERNRLSLDRQSQQKIPRVVAVVDRVIVKVTKEVEAEIEARRAANGLRHHLEGITK